MTNYYLTMRNSFAKYYVFSKALFVNLKEKGFFHLLSSKYLIRFIGFGSQLFVIKFLSPLELGQIKTIQSFLGIAALAATFGFNTSVLKLCSEKNDYETKAAIFKNNYFYSLFSLTISMAAIFFLAKFKVLSPDDNINYWLPIFALSLPASAFIAIAGNYLQALKKIKTLAKTQAAFSLIGFVSLTVLTYSFGFIGFVISTLFMSYIGVPILYRILKEYLKSGPIDKEIKKRSVIYAVWSFAANLVGTLSGYLDIFILNFVLLDRADLGYYGVAAVFLLALTQITQSLTEIAAPYLSEKSNDKKEFYRVLFKYEKILFIVSFILTLSTIFVLPFFISFVYGPSYSLSGTLFQILAIRFFLNSSFTLFGISVLAVGKMNYNFLSTALAVPINFAITYYFAVNYGAIGAAIGQVFAALVTLAFRFPISIYALKKHFNEISTNKQ